MPTLRCAGSAPKNPPFSFGGAAGHLPRHHVRGAAGAHRVAASGDPAVPRRPVPSHVRGRTTGCSRDSALPRPVRDEAATMKSVTPIQSVTVHLISLCLQLEHGYTSDQAREALVQAIRYKTEFVWLDPPPSLGPVTILDVRNADAPAAFKDVVRGWAQSVWQAWQPYPALFTRTAGHRSWDRRHPCRQGCRRRRPAGRRQAGSSRPIRRP